MNIPIGVEHLLMLERASVSTNAKSAGGACNNQADLAMIGTAMSALYQAATCHRSCHGSGHVLEAICGRAYNLGAASYILINCGCYDEALNLVRSLGEASNLIGLSIVDKGWLREWLTSDARTRRTSRKFQMKGIRDELSKKAPALLVADDDWYSRFCESYTHVTPHTQPNVHNALGQRFVGTCYQPEGYAKALGELATLLGGVAMMVCKYFKFQDLFDELQRHARGALP